MLGQNKDTQDTRMRIMEVAFELFGRFGFEGTSIRAIAKESHVNLAAVNYHFKSKENLFWEIMTYVYREVENDVKNFSQEAKDTQDLALKLYDYFIRENLALKSTMKMMLAEQVTLPDSKELMEVLNNPMGPPGGQYFAEMIQKEIPYKLSREGLLWGVKSVFGSVNHWAMLCSAEKMSPHCTLDPLMSPDQLRKDVSRMVESSMIYLKAQRHQFEEKN